jgi:hypothetical protein
VAGTAPSEGDAVTVHSQETSVPREAVDVSSANGEGDHVQLTGPHADGEFVLLLRDGLQVSAVSLTKAQLKAVASMCRRMAK